MSDTNEVNIKYDDLLHTNYPQQIDKLKTLRDPNANEVVLIQQYNNLMASGNYMGAVEHLNTYPSLKECIINADLLLSMHHSIIALQRFFHSNVQDKIYRIGKQKGDWNENMSSDASDESLKLNMYDIVRYPVDGLKQYFMVISSEIVAGILPTNAIYYMQMSIKGDKGDTGYTPQKNIDYWDGENGTGLSPCGLWVDTRTYTQYDMVSYNGDLWYLTTESSINEVPENYESWERIILSVKLDVGVDVREDLEDEGIWFHQQEDSETHIILKTKTSSGEFLTLYPETKEAYITDSNGENLQEKLYHLYFNRLDVITTTTINDSAGTCSKIARLKDNEDITVATYFVTDTLETDSTVKTEFNIYDETGATNLYRIIETTIETENEDGTVSYNTSRYRSYSLELM